MKQFTEHLIWERKGIARTPLERDTKLIAQSKTMNNKTQAKNLLYICTDAEYYNYIHANIIEEVDEVNQHINQIITPCVGIRYFQQKENSKWPRQMKGIANSIFEIKRERQRTTCCKKLLKDFLQENTLAKLEFVHQMEWLKAVGKVNFISKIQRKSKRYAWCKSKKEFLERFNVNGIYCGDLCADTYIRYKSEASFDINDDFMETVINNAAALIDYYKLLYKRYNPIAVIGTDTEYIHHGIPQRVARKMGIRTVTIAGLEESYKIHSSKYSLSKSDQPAYCANYHEYKPELVEYLSEHIVEQATENLESRVKGRYDGAFSYMNKKSEEAREIDASRSYNGKIVMMLHCFFDAGHMYNWGLFSDFAEWAEETLEFCTKNRIELTIKPHPAQVEESKEVVFNLQEKFKESKSIEWISSSTQNSYIFESKPALIISIFGSVAAEATYADVPVLLAGDHPGINFSVGHVAKTKEEYFYLLKNTKNVRKGKRSDAISFTAQHYKNLFSRKGDSLKSHINITEEEWLDLETYKRTDVTKYTRLITKQLVADLIIG